MFTGPDALFMKTAIDASALEREPALAVLRAFAASRA